MAGVPLSPQSMGLVSFEGADSLCRSFVIAFKTSVEEIIKNVCHVCFLEDYNVPALAVLFEPQLTDVWYVHKLMFIVCILL